MPFSKKTSFGEPLIYVGIKPFLIKQFNNSQFFFEHALNTWIRIIRPPCLMHFLPGARGKQNMGKEKNARQTPVGKLSVFLGHRTVKIQIKCRRENASVFRHTMFRKSLFQRNFLTE